MSLLSRGNAINCFTCVCLGLLVAPPARGQEPRLLADEVREYETVIKGKTAGKTLTRITEFDDGATVAVINANIKIDSWFHNYQYEFHGREIWRGGELLHADGHATEDGKKRSVTATVNGRGSIIELPGKPQQTAPKLAVTTTYWRLPDMPAGTNNLAIMDADSGALETGWFKRVGPEKITVDGRTIACVHFRVVGAAKAELWFDDHSRLVRQQTPSAKRLPGRNASDANSQQHGNYSGRVVPAEHYVGNALRGVPAAHHPATNCMNNPAKPLSSEIKPFELAIVARGTARLTIPELAAMRKQPPPCFSPKLTPLFLKHSDEQTLAALAALYRAKADFGLESEDFGPWAVVALISRFWAGAAFAAA